MGSSTRKETQRIPKDTKKAFYLIESAPINDKTLTKRLSIEKIIKYDHISKYETRRTNDLQIPKLLLELSKESFSCVSAKVLNDIPNDIRNMESTGLVKHKLKTYLLDQ